MAKLKVYRTPIGFHDAYVAAPSQKAALEAWGAKANLFARGVAELVDDPELTTAPLAHPGEVLRVMRGSVAEQMAALGSTKPKPKTNQAAEVPRAKPKPPPKRTGIDAAEKALETAGARHERALNALDAEWRKLNEREKTLRRKQSTEIDRLKQARDDAEHDYRAALDRYEG